MYNGHVRITVNPQRNRCQFGKVWGKRFFLVPTAFPPKCVEGGPCRKRGSITIFYDACLGPLCCPPESGGKFQAKRCIRLQLRSHRHSCPPRLTCRGMLKTAPAGGRLRSVAVSSKRCWVPREPLLTFLARPCWGVGCGVGPWRCGDGPVGPLAAPDCHSARHVLDCSVRRPSLRAAVGSGRDLAGQRIGGMSGIRSEWF